MCPVRVQGSVRVTRSSKDPDVLLWVPNVILKWVGSHGLVQRMDPKVGSKGWVPRIGPMVGSHGWVARLCPMASSHGWVQ